MGDIIKGYFTELMSNNNTRKCYIKDLEDFYGFACKQADKVDEVDIVAYISFLESQGYKNSTINRKIYSLKSVFKILTDQGTIPYNPFNALTGSIHHKVPDPPALEITVEEVFFVCLRVNGRLALIIKFLANTGIRVSELCNIKYGDVTLKQDRADIYIRGKNKVERTIWISRTLYDEIHTEFKDHPDYLFSTRAGDQYSRICVTKMIANAFHRYLGKKVSAHTLRHLYITENEPKFGLSAVSRSVGHSTPTTTMRYCHKKLNPGEGWLI